MRNQYRLPCSGRSEGPLWQSLCNQKLRSPAHHTVGWVHTQAAALKAKQLSIWGPNMRSAPRRFSILTQALLPHASTAGTQPAAARSLSLWHRTGMAENRLQQGRWGMTGLRHMSSEIRTGDSISRHYGLKRSVRVAATGEAGFVKGAGVVGRLSRFFVGAYFPSSSLITCTGVKGVRNGVSPVDMLIRTLKRGLHSHLAVQQ